MTMSMSTKALVAATTLAVSAGLGAAPAQAAGPTRAVESLDFTVVEHPLFTEACGFPVSLHVWGDFLVRTWLDEDGDPVRELRNFRFRSTTEANGKVVHGSARGPETSVYHEDGSVTVHIRGVVNRRVPGAGTVVLSSGFGLGLFPADGGPDVVVIPTRTEDLQPVCDYLAS